MLHASENMSSHHMSDAVLKIVYQAVVISRLLCSATACRWGFTKAADCQRMDASPVVEFLLHGFCDPSMPAVSDLVECAVQADHARQTSCSLPSFT